MDGSSRAFGVGPRIKLCGREYTVYAKTVGCYSEVEAQIRKMRGDPAAMLAGRAIEFSKLNTGPMFDRMATLLRDQAEREKWSHETLHLCSSFLDQARVSLDTSGQYEDVLRRAFDEAREWSMVSMWDIHKFLDESWQGQCMKVWFAIRQNDRDLTLERVTKMYYDHLIELTRSGGDDAALEFRREFERAVAIAEGTDSLGNSTGSSPSSSATEANL